MSLVTIKRQDKNPPSDDVIKQAMTQCGGTVSTVVTDGTDKKVTFTGNVNHTDFRNALIKLVAGSGQNSWDIVWPADAALFGTSMAGTTGTQYGITIHNQSGIDNQNAIVFQKAPSLPSDVHTLAWLSKMCHNGTQVYFNWMVDFNFVWGQNGTLAAGANYEAGGVADADLQFRNQVTLSYPNNGFEFGQVTQGPSQGSLFILENGVPGAGDADQGSVGIGMMGQGTFVRPTQSTGPGGALEFSVHPEYWIAFGVYEPGVVIDEMQLTYPQAVPFGVGQYKADCTFDGSGWAITYSQ